TVRTAADLDFPIVAVSLVSRAGYFRQSLDEEGRQSESPAQWRPEDWSRPLNAKVAVEIEGRRVWVGAWLYVVEAQLGGRQPVLLLDTDYAENDSRDREITHYLYGGDDAYRLKQEIVLGIGGVRLLLALGFRIRAYHMNEGHSALLGLELLRRYRYAAHELQAGESPYDLPRARAMCRFTTHTPLDAGHDQFPYDLVARTFGDGATEDYVDTVTLKRLGGEEALNMTRLALNVSEYVNGVAERHAETSQKMYPGYHVHAITNGVHPFTWVAEGFRALYDRYLPGWCHEPERLSRAGDVIPGEAIDAAHRSAKQALIARVAAATGRALDPERPILGFARRMTSYKRPDLLFEDLGRLRAIAAKHPFQIILAGKAHPHDERGKELIGELFRAARSLGDAVPTVFLADYDMDLAHLMVAGSDVWLNTPLPPLEASGTSGMKAALNGVPSLSVLDGWWVEGCIEGVTGWAVGALGDGGAGDLYAKLGEVVLPLYYARGADPSGWRRVMIGAIAKNGAFFNSHRMMRRYATEAYQR
ncbi:MAG TPA: alpha-glucan family phosphorylase, partial [Steroidobacteraceae bacterium]|nr:alpha-glucan family phosphorylase [Steroidobacteraceae bacterium]